MSLQTETLEPELVYSLLADRVRTDLLRHLSQADRTTVSTAADRIVDRYQEATGSVSVDRTVITVQLIHNHLPRLDLHGVVAYDRSSNVVRPGPNFGDLEPFVTDGGFPDRFE